MESILEIFQDNRLRAVDEQFEQSADYKSLETELSIYVNDWLWRNGKEKRPIVERLIEIIFEQQELSGNDSFLNGFRLGVLSTVEIYINREKFIAPKEKPSDGTDKESQPVGKPYRHLILKYLADERVRGSSVNVTDRRSVELDKEYYACLEAALDGAEKDPWDPTVLSLPFAEITRNIALLKDQNRFAYGYSLGVFIITDVFQSRDKIITD